MRQKEQFDIIYNDLNEQQKRAVDTIEGPVMVIAGPGTGKTQILGARIGRILLDTDTQPENILCLTYTDAGVVAMRKRLLKFIGPDAYKVNIYTFHAFCNDIIQENLSLFEKSSLDPVSELEKIELFKQLIDSFPKNHPLKRYRGDVYFEIRNLQLLFSTMKREGWTPAMINQKIDEYLNDIPNREEFVYKRAYKQFKAGDLKESRIEEAREKMEKLRAAVNEFDRFQQIMRSRNRYDFDDMINWVIRAFEENKLLLTRYQEQYLYILVDEYQDTSGTQNRLVELLISYWQQPNVFVVGDDDQSIYRFQGANVENMLGFASSYQQDLLTIVLTNNYRSTQPILDISKTLIDRNEERLIRQIDGLSKTLLSSHKTIRELRHQPLIREYETQRQEMIHITLEVEKLIGNGVMPGHIGIIYKENRYGEELTQYFSRRNIPVFSKRSLNILQIPLAQKLILLLKYLAAEHDMPYGGDEMLFEILHFNWFRIAPIEIAKLSAAVADKRFSDSGASLRRALYEKVNAPVQDLFSQGPPAGMREACQAIESLIADVSNTTLVNLVENCLRKALVLNWIMQDAEKHVHLQVIGAVFDFVKDEARRNQSLNLEQLVNLFMLMQKEEISLPLVQVSGSDKGVNLLTVHGSKGLEFEHVFLAGCNAGNWEKKRKPGGGYAFPDTMFSSQPKSRDEEELRRLFYVGLTRAQQHLHISYTRFRNDGKEWEPSMFIEEIQETHLLPVEKIVIDAPALSEFAMIQFNEQQSPEIERIEADFITQLLDKFVMNVTALNNYLKCPLQFYFQNLVRVPCGKSEAAEFGSAVHYALEKLFSKMQQTEAFAPKAEFIRDFEWYMLRHRENFTREQFARRMEYGQEVLANYYDRYIGSWNKIVAVERNIRNVVVQGVPIKGKLDKLEFDGKSVNVVDYKTGDIDKAKDKLLAPGEKDPNGGDYWRQAVFYKMLVDNYEQKNWKVTSTEFDFIEPDKKKQYRKEKLMISPEDITTVTQQVKAVWQKIQERDFYQGCGKPDCHWCNFVKTNQMAVALHEVDTADEQ
ncbi:MAG: ATP-dependent helicase [Chitinophagaceae bacterium]|nr:ATP-dependent helicase [Chitinophagaceae bacterium]